MTAAQTIPIYILAGGRSSRFGRDKASFVIRGRTLVDWVVEPLRPLASRIAIVSSDRRLHAGLGFEYVGDLRPGLGPIGGVWTALEHDRAAEWILCATCDRVGLRASWIRAMLDARRPGVQAVVFRDTIWQPFPGLYHRSMRAAIRQTIEQGSRTLFRIFPSVRTLSLPVPEGWSGSVDINDATELERVIDSEFGGP